jgi:hypothetical protein
MSRARKTVGERPKRPIEAKFVVLRTVIAFRSAKFNPFIGTRLNIGKSPGAIYESEEIEQE